VRNRNAAAVEHAVQIHRDHALPRIQRILPARCHRSVDPRVVDENIHLAQCVERGREGLFDGLGGRHVNLLDVVRREAEPLRLAVADIEVPHGHACAIGFQLLRDAQTDAARRAGDDGDFTVERASHCSMFPCVKKWCCAVRCV
jgi:hypothetical protein